MMHRALVMAAPGLAVSTPDTIHYLATIRCFDMRFHEYGMPMNFGSANNITI